MSSLEDKITFTFLHNKFRYLFRKKPKITFSKNVLKNNSEYFNSLFSGRWKEVETSIVEGHSWAYYKAFKVIIKFMDILFRRANNVHWRINIFRKVINMISYPFADSSTITIYFFCYFF